MGLFDFFRKKKKQPDLEKEDVIINEKKIIEKAENTFDNKKQIEHYVLDKCEQIIENSKQLEDSKLEYQLVTDYLTDIQMIESIPPKQRKIINDTADEIVQLKKKREDFHQISKKLSDAQFSRIRTYEDEVPESLKRLKSNEAYQSTVKRDMNCLEGEKGDLTFRINAINDEQRKLTQIIYVVPVLFVLLCAAVFLVQRNIRADITVLYFAIFFVSAACGTGIYIRTMNNTNTLKRLHNNLNYAIVMLNRAKIKYVNETNAVEYAYEKYGVHSSYELSYLWDEYIKIKAEKERFMRSTDDLDYYNKKLLRELAKYDLEDVSIWEYQVEALLNEKEMVEVRHSLNQRRQKLRSQMEYNSGEMNNIKQDVIKTAKNNPKYSKEILDIVKSIDSLDVI